MAFVNYNNKEITVKIVYYGPALSGKTTCLKYIYSNKEFQKKGKLITLDTDGDRTLFFDFLPIEIGQLGDYSIKMQLYTVPGQVSYDATRKLVLQGADGVVFIADSQVIMRDQNIESFDNLKENLKANNIAYSEIPIILQFNKRDLKEILPIDNINDDINQENRPFFPTIATTGENIHEALHTIMKMVIIYLKNKLSVFQRDKTVMFSREEVTSESSENEEKKGKGEKRDKSTEDTEKEAIFELSSPLIDAEEEAESSDSKDEDIFNLEDNILDGFIEDDIQEEDSVVQLEDDALELETEKPKKSAEQKTEPEKSKEQKPAKEVEPKTEIQTINVPLNLEIPKNKNEVKVNLNLQIVIKKK